jgi:hypothetical protein
MKPRDRYTRSPSWESASIKDMALRPKASPWLPQREVRRSMLRPVRQHGRRCMNVPIRASRTADVFVKHVRARVTSPEHATAAVA